MSSRRDRAWVLSISYRRHPASSPSSRLSWKHFFVRDLKHREIEQFCIITAAESATVAAVESDADSSASDARSRPKCAEPKSARAARYAAQLLSTLEAASKPVAPLVCEFIEILPDKVPAALPPGRDVRHEIDLTPGAKYCVTRQLPLPVTKSRRPMHSEDVVAITVTASIPFRHSIAAAYESDTACAEMVRFLRDPSDAARRRLSSRSRARVDRYALDGYLPTYCVGRTDRRPAGLLPPRPTDSRVLGHIGGEKTFALLSRDFYWPHMYKWVRKWIRSCEACRRVKPSPSKQAPLRPLPAATRPWASLSMDFEFGLPCDSQGRTDVLVFVDRFSKMVYLAPVVATTTAVQSAVLFLDTVCRHHGLPISIVSD
ncbi:hypothetical protein PC128_g18314 [Phytophthora cactorum]|nr:hypothetical protein PC120_g16011 [Phytophthora cactorum]KAG3173349.1 hypothetical protein PC128_g18314 [Phytophthora cactorum]